MSFIKKKNFMVSYKPVPLTNTYRAKQQGLGEILPPITWVTGISSIGKSEAGWSVPCPTPPYTCQASCIADIAYIWHFTINVGLSHICFFYLYCAIFHDNYRSVVTQVEFCW